MQCVIQPYERVGSFINIIEVFIVKLLILILTTRSYKDPSLPPHNFNLLSRGRMTWEYR